MDVYYILSLALYMGLIVAAVAGHARLVLAVAVVGGMLMTAREGGLISADMAAPLSMAYRGLVVLLALHYISILGAHRDRLTHSTIVHGQDEAGRPEAELKL